MADPPRTLPRLARFLGLCAVVGGVATVAVAWACALVVPPDPQSLTCAEPTYHVHGSSKPDSDVVISYRTAWVRPGLRLVDVHVFTRDPLSTWIEDQRGWPMPSLRSTYPKVNGAYRLADGLPTFLPAFSTQPDPSFPVLERALPLRPVWPGFAISFASLAALTAALLLLARFGRRRFRLMRGRCPACAYPAGASAVCSECGSVLPHGKGAGS